MNDDDSQSVLYFELRDIATCNNHYRINLIIRT